MLSLACFSFLGLSAEKSAPKNLIDKKVQNNMNKVKLGFVDYQQLMSLEQQTLGSTIDEWRDGIDAIKVSLKPVDEKLAELDKKYAEHVTEIKSMQKSELTSKSALQRKYEEIAKLEQELQAKLQERERELRQEVGQLTNKVKPKIDNIVKQVREEESIDVIFKIQKDAVCIADDADLTSKVFTIANNNYAKELKLAQGNKAASKPESSLNA